MRLLLNIDWSFFDKTFLGEKLSNCLVCAGIIVATFLLKRPAVSLLTRVSTGLAARFNYSQYKDTIQNMLFKPVERLLQVVLFFIAVNQMDSLLDRIAFHHTFAKEQINVRVGDVIDHIFLFLFIVFLTSVISNFSDFIYYLRIARAKAEKDNARLQILPLFKEMTKLFAWVLCAFCVLGFVFHVNVPALITGLGIGGVAIALAGKETVENFFASFTILSDQPFRTGETIRLGDIEGVVERIGFRSTRLRNADGSAYIIPNQNLVSQNLINLSSRDMRIMKITVNLKYGITQEALQQLIGKLKDALTGMPNVKEPIDAVLETFDKETFMLVISYSLPHPLPDETTLTAIKRDANMKVFEVITASAVMGTPIGTS